MDIPLEQREKSYREEFIFLLEIALESQLYEELNKS
jgi:hypothetical protein